MSKKPKHFSEQVQPLMTQEVADEPATVSKPLRSKSDDRHHDQSLNRGVVFSLPDDAPEDQKEEQATNKLTLDGPSATVPAMTTISAANLRLDALAAKAETDDSPAISSRQRLVSIAIVDWILFSIALQYSIYFASLWPYLSQIDREATEDFFGWVIAIYCVGQIIASPLYGYWSNHSKSLRFAAITAVLFGMVGNVVFVLAENFPTDRRFVLFSARLVMGLSSGLNGSCRAYVATSSTKKQRSRAISVATACMSLGFIAGPAFQAIVAFIGYPGYQLGPFHISMYTMPAILLVIANLLSVLLMMIKFKDDYSGIKETRSEIHFDVVPKFSVSAVAILCWCWFCTFFTMTNLESVGAPYGMAMFDWNRKEATVYGSVLMGASSILSLIIYALYAWKGRKIENRVSILTGLVLTGAFFVLTFSYPFYPYKLHYKSTDFNATDDDMNVGCAPEFTWCEWTPAIPFTVYIVAYPLLFVGYPPVNVSLSVLFSEVLGPRPQAFMQSILMMCGSTAKLIAPLVTMYLFTSYGPMAVWSVPIVLMVSSIVLVTAAYNMLVPMDLSPYMKDANGPAAAAAQPQDVGSKF